MLGGLIGNLGGAVDQITGEAGSGENKFPKTLKTSAFFDSNVSLTANEYGKLGEFIVPAQEQYRWGQGAATVEATVGFLYIFIKDDTDAEVTGSVRLQQRDAQERNIVTVYEEEAEILHAEKNNRDKQQALPEQRKYPKVGHQSKLVIAFNPDSEATVSATNTEILAPVTVYPV
jgi:hypothetical protein